MSIIIDGTAIDIELDGWIGVDTTHDVPLVVIKA